MSTELDKQAREDSLKRLARLLDRLHMFVPKCSGDTACHYCGSPYAHEVHWREGECSWSAKYRVMSESAFASQVREQSIAECAEVSLGRCRQLNADAIYAARHGNYESRERYESMARVAEGIAEVISKLPAPPETTEQEE